MNAGHRVRWVVPLLALGMLYLPLRAAEAPPAASPGPAAEEAAKPPTEGNAKEGEADEAAAGEPDEAAAGEPSAQEASGAEPQDPEDRLSADNNLSYPVDI